MSRKECHLATFLLIEHHISRRASSTPAIGRVHIPICGSKIVAPGISEGASDFFYRTWNAFQFEKVAHRCFIEVHMDPGKAQARAVFFIVKTGAEAELFQFRAPDPGKTYRHFPFEPLFVPRLAGLTDRRVRPSPWRRLGRKYRAGASRGNQRGASGCLDTKTEEATSAPQVRLGSIE